MMRFNVGGQFLELPDNFSVQFKKTNILFAFDKAECERSASFDVPDTPTNNRILGISKWVQTSGDGMRRRYDAQLQASGVTKDGYLYVDSYSKGKYKAVFVTGELLGLQRLRNAGKIPELLSNVHNTTSFGIYSNSPSSVYSNLLWTNIKHKSKNGIVYPSWKLNSIIDSAMQEIGAAWQSPNLYVRAIVRDPKLLQSMPLEISRRTTENYWVDVTISQPLRITTIGTGAAVSDVLTTDDYAVEYRRHWQDYDFQTQQPVLRTVVYTGNVQHFIAQQRLAITFDADFPSDVYIGTFQNAGAYSGTFSFLGDRSFGKSWDGTQSVTQRTGDPLAGRSVTIEKGQSFCFIKESDLLDYTQYTGNTSTIETWEQGWKNVRSDADFDLMQIEGTGDVGNGFYLRLADNLPDVSVIDLLKTISALTGTVLYYTDANGVTFDTLDFDTWSIKDISKSVIDASNMMRKFGDFAQSNLVQFKEDESVLQAERIITAYNIQNENIESENVLQDIPFSEGGADGIYTYVRETSAQILSDADYTKTTAFMIRVELPKIPNLQTLCDASTSVQVRARMTLLEFDHITPKTLIYYAGVRYVWTEAQWSKGVVTLKLSKT